MHAEEGSGSVWRAIGEAVTLGAFVAGQDGGVCEVSDEFLALTGLSLEAIRGDGWLACVHPDDVTATRAEWERCVARGTPWRGEHRLRAADGSYRDVITRAAPVRAADGAVSGWAGVHIDITRTRHVERALRRAQHTVEELSHRLQANLLPPLANASVPARVAWRYKASEERMLLGGDFFDLVEGDDGELAFVIGDVAGHGPESAALGANLRAAWRALVLAGVPLEGVLPTLERLIVADAGPGMFVTACTGTLDSGRTRLRYALAGHPPPLLMRAGELFVLSPPERGPALAVAPRRRAEWAVHSERLSGEWWLLAYTDGLTEARSAPGAEDRYGLARLATRLAGHPRLEPADLDRLLAEVESAQGAAFTDDVAVLLASGTAVAAPVGDGDAFAFAVAGDPLGPSEARHRVVARLRERAGDEVTGVAELLVSELVTNSVRHAAPGDVDVRVAMLRDAIRIEVRDGGSGFAHRPAEPVPDASDGRGLMLVDRLARRWGVLGGRQTCVWFELDAPLQGRVVREPTIAPAPGPLAVRTTPGADGTRVVLAGELDLAGAGVLEAELRKVGETERRRVVVDLRGLRFVDSSGLRALLAARDAAEHAGRAFAIVRGYGEVDDVFLATGVDAAIDVEGE